MHVTLPNPGLATLVDAVTTPVGYLRIALDPVRLAILGHAAVGPVKVAELADRLGVSQRKLMAGIARLREAGLLDETWRLDKEALRELAAALPKYDPPVDLGSGEWSEEEVAVLARFFSGSRLSGVPAQRSKRLVVLERLAQEFEPGRRYREEEVNAVLSAFHEDYATLRRYLVDEDLLAREAGVYWRTGGRVDVPA